MVNRKARQRTLVKRLASDLREKLGAASPEVLHVWAEPNADLRGATLRAYLLKDGVERIALGSTPKFDWEETYQRLLAASLEAWPPADPNFTDDWPTSE